VNMNFVQAVTFWAALMGEPVPPISHDKTILRDGRACQTSFDGYGPSITHHRLASAGARQSKIAHDKVRSSRASSLGVWK
jgi:hypothetical protein